MKKQSIVIISLLVIGTLFGVGYSASTVISDSGITTSTITVSGACNGCGNEPSFTTWTTALNGTIAGTTGKANSNIYVSNDGSVLALDQNGVAMIVFLNGTAKVAATSAAGSLNTGQIVDAQSSTGEYKIIEFSNGVSVYKNNSLIQTLGLTAAQFKFGTLGNEGVAISPNGKYIAVQGIDSGGAINRLVIFGGS